MNAARFTERLHLDVSTPGLCHVECSGSGSSVVNAIVRRLASHLGRTVREQVAPEFREVEVRPLRSRS
jgi:hypothetical protein